MAARKRPTQAQRGLSVSGGWLFRPILGAISALTYYTLAVRPWLLRWGATAEELSTPLPGDQLVPAAAYTTTRAVTVRASAESIWPWLVQLGQARAARWAMDWTWTFALRPLPDGATRLLVRTRADYRPHAVLAPVVRLLLEPMHFVMERGMLIGIKPRAEHAATAPATIAGDPWLPATSLTQTAGPASSSTPAADRSHAWQSS